MAEFSSGSRATESRHLKLHTRPLFAATTALLIFVGLVSIQLTGVFSQWNEQAYFRWLLVAGDSSSDSGLYLLRWLTNRLTHLGDTLFCTFVAIEVLFWGWVSNAGRTAVTFAVTLSAVSLTNYLLKNWFAIARPPNGDWLASFSFPSGHASSGGTLWFMLGWLAFNSALSLPQRRAFGTMFILTGLLVAASRLLIGVHWPLDVIAGLFEALFFTAVFVYLLNRDGLSVNRVPDPLMLFSMIMAEAVLFLLLSLLLEH